ncbi:MAG: hypothetical protein ACR2O4_12340 [Hyphomicrobiaceae bacterium]
MRRPEIERESWLDRRVTWTDCTVGISIWAVLLLIAWFIETLARAI